VHDPLCLYDELTRDYLCACPLIKRVRKNELAIIEQRINDLLTFHSAINVRPGRSTLWKMLDKRRDEINAD